MGTVRDLARLGDAVVETEVGTVLAAGAYPGERVELADVRKRGGALRGRLVRVIEPSPSRRDAPCPYADRCGGCPWMGLDPAAQREIKRRFVERATGVETEMHPAPRELGYRRRARLAFARGRIGYRHRGARTVADVPSCAVLEPALDRALELARAEWGGKLAGEGEIALSLGDAGRAVIALRSETAQPPAAYEAARVLAGRDEIAGVSIRAGGATVDAAFGDPRERTIGPGGEALWGSVFGFSQAQDLVNAALVETAVALAEPAGARVLELYAGHGNLTVPLAAQAAELVAVEADPEAAEACRQNLSDRGLAAKVITGDAAAYAAGSRVDAVVVDPPRAGARDALAGIVGRAPARIVYVSCDTATLARDVEELRRARYLPDHAHAFDMFPHTAHVEAVVRLMRSAR